MSATTRRYLVALIILLATAAAVEAVRIMSNAPSAFAPDFATLPMKIGDYQGQPREVDEFIRKYLSAEQMLERLYTGPDGSVSVTFVHPHQPTSSGHHPRPYATGSQERPTSSSRICLLPSRRHDQ